MRAASEGHSETVQMLLRHGARFKNQDKVMRGTVLRTCLRWVARWVLRLGFKSVKHKLLLLSHLSGSFVCVY